MATLEQMEHADLDDVTYYEIVVWTDKTTYGKHIDVAYKDLASAVMEMERLIKTEQYERITVRETYVAKRRANCDYSTSGVVKDWEAEGGN